MASVKRSLLALLVIAVLAGYARADRVYLKNGNILSGEITKEGEEEITILLDAGMEMTLRRAMIRKVEKEERRPEPAPAKEPKPVPKAEPDPEPAPKAEPAPERKVVSVADDPSLFKFSADTDWNSRFGRYPVIEAARNVNFRAYRYVGREPLALDPKDPAIARTVREHGHGGVLATWKFEYIGARELSFGDQVKFILEITQPEVGGPELIRLKLGPVTFAPRMVVMLVKGKDGVHRYATNTVFNGPDFRQVSLDALREAPQVARTYTRDFGFLTESWLEKAQREYLDGLLSPFGESVSVELERYRFRVDWYRTAPDERPALDRELLSRDAVRPLAREGMPTATMAEIRRQWGAAASNRERLRQLTAEIRAFMKRLGIRPGGHYRLERDVIGVAGRKGVTIVTERHELTPERLERLMVSD